MKKRGFTLIELLAVIALIVTPVVTKVIDGAKKGVVEANSLAYIDAVEKYMLIHDMNPEKYPYKLEKGKLYSVSNTEIEYNSLLPKLYA